MYNNWNSTFYFRPSVLEEMSEEDIGEGATSVTVESPEYWRYKDCETTIKDSNVSWSLEWSRLEPQRQAVSVVLGRDEEMGYFVAKKTVGPRCQT